MEFHSLILSPCERLLDFRKPSLTEAWLNVEKVQLDLDQLYPGEMC